MSGKCHKKGLWLDPRAKLFLILICVLSSMFAPSLAYQFVLVMLIAILGAFFGKWKYVIKAVCFYAVICVLTVLDHGRNDRHAADNVYCLFRIVS